MLPLISLSDLNDTTLHIIHLKVLAIVEGERCLITKLLEAKITNNSEVVFSGKVLLGILLSLSCRILLPWLPVLQGNETPVPRNLLLCQSLNLSGNLGWSYAQHMNRRTASTELCFISFWGNRERLLIQIKFVKHVKKDLMSK